ncbi:DinB family protein [Vitellibacter sp. q18]|jgi:hypothetical protein|nr:DinB family protein [Aequorivita lutea]
MWSETIPASEFNPYYKTYIDLVSETSIPKALSLGMEEVAAFFESLPHEKWQYRYAPNKWTPKDILQHIADTERVFAYRALYFSRYPNADLKGFDENIFAENAMANEKSVATLLENYKAVRAATLSLFSNFNDDQSIRMGRANGSDMSVRAAGVIIRGHEIHHCRIIKERYL